ncbi:MAG: hypothetical protein HC772_02335 [Leptolyngbyaceae cyanobacterium CRU_2_3]|nr:hypothetical protein [Leptolyngbyaceae cyanobacterium CRU_2_3]
MNYRDALAPWCIIQHLPKMQHAVIARFRKRNEAQEYLKVVKRLNPAIVYEIVFDLPNRENREK